MNKKSAKEQKKAPRFFFPAQGKSVEAENLAKATEKVGDLKKEKEKDE